MFEIFLLSLVQSLTEFLPVSSSGHLVLLKFFGLSHQNLVMDLTLHLGTLFAVLFYFRGDIKNLLFGFWHQGAERDLALKLIVATIPVCCVGFFLIHFVENWFYTPTTIAITSIVFGVLLWLSDTLIKKNKSLKKLTFKGVFIIGCFQILALIPGTSRSGITITAARLLGLNRPDSAKFSMLLSVPTITAGALLAFSEASHETLGTSVLSMGAAVVLSAIFGLIAISFLMKWVQKSSFAIFAIYRLILGAILLLLF